MATKKQEAVITIPPIIKKQFCLHLIGDTSLISHAWSEKAKMMMVGKHLKKASAGKEMRYPMQEFVDSLYWLVEEEKPNLEGLSDEEAEEVLKEVIPKSKFGFPASGFKTAAIDGAFQQKAIEKKTTARGAIHILGELVEINGKPTMHSIPVRIGQGTADIRYRAEFKEWSATLYISYNATAMSIEQIVNFFNIGGYSNGIGDWRPAKNGEHGRFHVDSIN